jgi:hypothetical protein
MTLLAGLLTLLPYGGFMSVLPVTSAMSTAEQGAKVKTIFSEMVECGADAGRCSAARPGRAVQVDPIKSTLKLKYDQLVSNFIRC